MWQKNQTDNFDIENSIEETIEPEKPIHQTPQKNDTDKNKLKNVTFRPSTSEPNTPVFFKTPKAMSTPYHTSLHETDVGTDDEDKGTTDDNNEDEEEKNEEKESEDEEDKEDNTENEKEENEEESTDNETQENKFNAINSIPPNLPLNYSRMSEKSSNITSDRENLTYHRNNYVHFLSADCEFTTPISRLLIDIAVIDPEEIKNKKPIKGQILVTPKGRYNIYSIIAKDNYYDPL
ncbi:myb-like protein X [Leptopilina heterotoma]|uniref:myb-like protein X n=1 Tax=Leptopilina heterotoma TaxID=63436 RepID=UPI001CA990FC|nr:myb-like protein X [Leptopilina heterotoma]